MIDGINIYLIETPEQLGYVAGLDDATIFITKEGCPFCEKTMPYLISQALNYVNLKKIAPLFELKVRMNMPPEFYIFLDRLKVMAYPTLVKLKNQYVVSMDIGAVYDEKDELDLPRTIELYRRYMERWD